MITSTYFHRSHINIWPSFELTRILWLLHFVRPVGSCEQRWNLRLGRDRMEHHWRFPQHGRHQPVWQHQDLYCISAFGPRHQRSAHNSPTSHCLHILIGVILKVFPYATGRMVYTSSIFSFFTCLNMGAYSVSKRGLEAFADCLRVEVASFGVKVR